MPRSFLRDALDRFSGGNLRESAPGALVSVLLHLALLLVVMWAFVQRGGEASRLTPFVPVDLVQLGADTVTPGGRAGPPQAARPISLKQQAASPLRDGLSPRGTKSPEDALDAKLKALARLSQPAAQLSLDNANGNADVTAGGGSGDRLLYSVKDYVRAQVMRRWSLDLGRIGPNRALVHLHMRMKRDGTVLLADVVDGGRGRTDANYRDIALGARNAALLSSPITLPPGDYPAVMEFTLTLDPAESRH